MYNTYNLTGYNFADGVHWYWNDKEIAIIDETTNEIEWTVRKYTLPIEVIKAVKSKRNTSLAEWKIEVRANRISATQGTVGVYINGDLIHSWRDEYKDGYFESENSNPGDYVFASMWHKHDEIYHYSDKVKDIFKPTWRD